MTSTAAVLSGPRGAGPQLAGAQPLERWVRHRVGLAWGLLFLNVLTFQPKTSVIPIPSILGKLITQGALPLAVLAALSVNRKIVVRPNVFMFLVTLLALDTVITCYQAQYLRSALYRTTRLVEFVVVLWLLTPFWGRGILLLRCHLKAMMVVLASVLLGLLVSPGHALVDGRLNGAIWPIPPTQVAHYAAVTIGLVTVLWLCEHRRGRVTLVIVAVCATILILTHTRTALAGVVGGVLVAGLSLIAGRARVRRAFAVAALAITLMALPLSGFITTWLARGQGQSQLLGLTGRTAFWGPLLAFPRDRFQMIFGLGLSNDMFNGLPIDSNWFTSYNDQGLFGVTVCATILIFLMTKAYFQPRSEQRALALFPIIYCLLASFTEVGFTSASTYLLDIYVAASLLVPTAGAWRPVRQ